MITCGEKAKIQKTETVHTLRHSFAFPLNVEQIFGSSIPPFWKDIRTSSILPIWHKKRSSDITELCVIIKQTISQNLNMIWKK